MSAQPHLTFSAFDASLGGHLLDDAWADSPQSPYSPQTRSGGKRPGSPLMHVRESPTQPVRPPFDPNIGSATSSQVYYAQDPSASNSFQYPPPGRRLKREHQHNSPHAHSRNSSISSVINGAAHLQPDPHSRHNSLAGMASLASASSEAAIGYDPHPHYAHPAPASAHLAATASESGNSAASMWPSPAEPVDSAERKAIVRLRAPSALPTSTPSSSALRHPPIERTTENVPHLYRSSQIPTGSDGQPGSPTYVSMTTKAVLQFDSDPNLMAIGWSHDEWLVKRRLVRFWRKQDGNVITSTFRPIGLNEVTPETIVISCIFREDKNECFVTSVDTIYLLEALVAVRFTVEEKNRIRRNLEGFKPITVSKTKIDSGGFFNLIMSFPNPKPRNIEKDVKVFPWKILGPALRKIISKYSASFLTPQDMAAGGCIPPQPIGWKPGQTPPGEEAINGDDDLRSPLPTPSASTPSTQYPPTSKTDEGLTYASATPQSIPDYPARAEQPTSMPQPPSSAYQTRSQERQATAAASATTSGIPPDLMHVEAAHQ
ncbi:hypothetical protein EMMF5_005580 [Cystobasidiomycetes sp. EMM_F5]